MVLKVTGRSPLPFRLRGLSPSMATLSSSLRLESGFVTPLGLRSDPAGPYNPRCTTATAFGMQRVWALPLSLATTQGMISLPGGTKMFQFPPFPPPSLCVQLGVPGHSPRRVSPFGHPRLKARWRLPEAYRSQPRPSSALGAKASTVRP